LVILQKKKYLINVVDSICLTQVQWRDFVKAVMKLLFL
jgi:hypothetical protein